MLSSNPVLDTDGYKFSHWKQYPPDTGRVFSYWEPRLGAKFDHVLFFAAIQYYLPEILRPVTLADIEEAEDLMPAHFGNAKIFNSAGWRRLLEKRGGVLPVHIMAPEEGSIIPVNNVLMTAENTDTEFPWLTNYLETRLSQMWYPVTIATQSMYARRTILKWLRKNGTPSEIDFKLHDFGFRGVTGLEQAAVGGLAHLANFLGSDTTPALRLARVAYQSKCAGFTIPAGEHSTITIWGEEHETDAFRNFLTQYPTGLVAFPVDSYDAHYACRQILGGTLRREIMARNGTVVARPDSGVPAIIVPQLLDALAEGFGWTINAKGKKVLPPQIRMIQGDGIKPPVDSIEAIYAAMDAAGWSSDNVAFGSGGGLLMNVDRDTERFAFKCSSAERAGRQQNVFKTVKTDPSKASKRGRVMLYRAPEGDIFTSSREEKAEPLLQTAYHNGTFTFNQSLDTIRRIRAANFEQVFPD